MFSVCVAHALALVTVVILVFHVGNRILQTNLKIIRDQYIEHTKIENTVISGTQINNKALSLILYSGRYI